MKKLTFAALMMVLVIFPACVTRNGGVKVGPTRTDNIDVATPTGTGPYNLELSMGAGTLQLNPGAGAKIVQGTVTYNVDDFKPAITSTGNTVRVEQGRPSVGSITGRIENDWNLELGDAPMALKLSVGAAKGSLELGGLSLSNLTVNQGASDFAVSFSHPNKLALGAIEYNAGAARSTLSGLANANAAKMSFKGGAGQLSLDFNGALQRDLQVTVSAAAGNVIVTVPAGVSALATVDGVMAKVTTAGGWSRSGNNYTLRGSGPTITLNVKMSVGKLDLRSS